MDISLVSQVNIEDKSAGQQKKEEIATKFEKIFAQNLVEEMTKDSFKMGDKNSPMGQSNSMYRHHITETLANEIAEQGKLGMAELIAKYGK